MVGIGTLDDLAAAEDFLADTGVTSFPLLWSASGESWEAFDVAAQPYTLLIRDGQVVKRWPGGASPSAIADAIEATAPA